MRGRVQPLPSGAGDTLGVRAAAETAAAAAATAALKDSSFSSAGIISVCMWM